MRGNLLKYMLSLMFWIGFLLSVQSGSILVAAEKSAPPAGEQQKMVRAKITYVHEQQNHGQGKGDNIQTIELVILGDNYLNEKFVTDFYPTGIFYGINLRENDEVFVTLTFNQAGFVENVHITEIARDKYMGYVLFGFMALLLVVGGVKGFRAMLSLFFTYLIIIKVLLPFILNGYNPVNITIALSSVITIITLLLVGGYNKKTFSAIVGTLCGLAAAAFLAVIIGDLSHLTGAMDDDFYLLEYLPQGALFNYQGLLFAGIIIGSLGAVMDVSMSIASAVNEMEETSWRLGAWQLIKAGMNVGKDTIGTMANTLILAYTGGSMYLLLLLTAENISLHQLINREIIAAEVLRSMAGSIGLVLTVPVTAIIAGFLIGKKMPGAGNTY